MATPAAFLMREELEETTMPLEAVPFATLSSVVSAIAETPADFPTRVPVVLVMPMALPVDTVETLARLALATLSNVANVTVEALAVSVTVMLVSNVGLVHKNGLHNVVLFI